MEITKKDVALAAKLAKMRVSEHEAAVYEAQLEALFNWVKDLSAVNTDGVELSNVNLSAHVRADEPVTDEKRAALLRADFNASLDDCAKVKKVL
ncbi:MAG: aspartyl/glutamyl-tRNA amidotransferase subunit C [Elusimicrobia bacterium]|nr:aspartyl/glutamyl-tRNA amidotransferase subunit C [Elusimicrobiota bacterium]MDD7579262.1 aspartyl/glutamyl-tRNA amidotransferase subunit C [Elusimicrobiota bacterium]MDY6039182.1 Asp-tRNA(Asn)/Glu-tRNA(Gln) amidotransferase subunit GatC [Elusimicrobiaceae bacterium]